MDTKASLKRSVAEGIDFVLDRDVILAKKQFMKINVFASRRVEASTSGNIYWHTVEAASSIVLKDFYRLKRNEFSYEEFADRIEQVFRTWTGEQFSRDVESLNHSGYEERPNFSGIMCRINGDVLRVTDGVTDAVVQDRIEFLEEELEDQRE